MTFAAPKTSLPKLASRLFGKPLAMRQAELDSVLAAVGGRLGLEGLPQAASSFEERDRVALSVTEDGIAVIQVMGPLVHRASGFQAMCGMTSYLDLGAELMRAVEDPRVSGILLDVDSGGGEVSGVFDLADQIRAAREAKPVYAVANEAAFSAAYAIASAADRIYLPRTGGVGSIGVVALHVDQSKHDEKEGLRYSYVHAGARKVEGNAHEPLGLEARATIQAEIDRVYDLFVGQVARNRGVSPDAIRATEAGVFFGREAIAKGLADRTGTRDEAYADLVAATSSKRKERDDMKLAEENEKLRAELAASLELSKGLQAELEAMKAEAASRREADINAYVDKLKAEAVEAQLPLSAEDEQEIRSLFASGHDTVARKLGDAHAKAAQKHGGKAFKRAPAPKGVSDDKALALKKNYAEAEKALLEASGHTVQLSEDGTKVLSATK